MNQPLLAMQIQLNGQSFEIEGESTITNLVSLRKLNPRQIAVEVNEVIVPREEYSLKRLSEGDQVELVSLAGGG